jgi:DNA-nicking Smr family endonuclease
MSESHLAVPHTEELAAVGIHDSMRFLANGIQQSVIKKLRSGYFGIDAEIDLHGLSRHVAKQQLLHFLHTCVEEGCRCVHIVHGKGYRSPDNISILKNDLNHWLRQHQDVQAFCSAKPNEGGTGALFVLYELPANMAMTNLLSINHGDNYLSNAKTKQV